MSEDTPERRVHRWSGLPGTVAVSAVLVLALSACGPEGGAPRRFLSIGTAGTGGIYYPLGGAIASRLSVTDSLRQYTAEVTGGSVENVNRVRSGQIDLGFALAMTVYEAYHGGPNYPEPVANLRIVAPLYANMTHILVPARSPITSLGEFAGRRVSVGAAGSGTEQLSRQILEGYDLTYDDIEPRFLSFTESAQALRDRAIDGAILSVGYPAAAVLEATTTGGARLLAMDEEGIARVIERYPFYSRGIIPAGVYPGVESEIPTVAALSWIVALEELESEVVTQVLDILKNQRASLVQVHEIAAQIDLNDLARAPIPLHPATEAWLARNGS